MMTRKDYVLLADYVRRDLQDPGVFDEYARGRILSTLADWCATQNPRFDRDRWIAYVYTQVLVERRETEKHRDSCRLCR